MNQVLQKSRKHIWVFQESLCYASSTIIYNIVFDNWSISVDKTISETNT